MTQTTLSKLLAALAACFAAITLATAPGCGGASDSETPAGDADNGAEAAADNAEPEPEPTPEVAGTYTLDASAIQAAMQEQIDAVEDPNERMGMQMAVGMIGAMQMSLTLNEDGTASSTMSMMGQTEETTGSWSMDGDTIAITMASEGQEPQTATATFSEGVLTMSPPEGEEMPFELIFNRQ